ncbi:hypothetical protein C8J55DRAFT_154449 [Lentinula edodes]|uniref:Uncharacterized protein n=1 Tax=Lentinula lateritia TaxID=40482 RepID=A0A9W9A2K0_9AGAR|nr:hypothetical protein C8J55DRAFT_154449 [Lentinula edodes]
MILLARAEFMRRTARSYKLNKIGIIISVETEKVLLSIWCCCSRLTLIILYGQLGFIFLCARLCKNCIHFGFICWLSPNSIFRFEKPLASCCCHDVLVVFSLGFRTPFFQIIGVDGVP